MISAPRVFLLCALILGQLCRADETLRIAVDERAAQATVSARGLSAGADEEEGQMSALPSDSVRVRAAGGALWLNGVRWQGAAVRFHAPAQRLRLDALTLRGDVVVKLSGQRLKIINVLPLEEYLAGVLGAEMPVTFPLEALKAQAVAARTYAFFRKTEMFGADVHLGSGVLSQVYKGLEEEDARTRAAVQATYGQILTYRLEPIEAYFHSSCGGRTESGKEALGRDLPYLQSVECPCGELAGTHWNLSVRTSELRRLFGQGDAAEFAVTARSATGRAQRVRVSSRAEVDAVTLRQKLGYAKLKSLWFEVESRRPGEVRLSGRGFGHGAGMCQWGAKLFAQKGWDYRRILAHYYPGTELQVLY